MASTEISPFSYAIGDHRLTISGPVGELEAILSVPPHAQPHALAVLCHPHPLFGGSMENKVIFTVHRACRDAGVASIRFNFRGVGKSEGTFDHGAGEQHDVLAVLSWAEATLGVKELTLIGFSFGAFVAAMVWSKATQLAWQGRSLMLIAPPVTRFPMTGFQLPEGARVIYGSEDEVVEPQAIADWLETQQATLDECVMPAASHFFHGRLTELRDWVRDGMRSGDRHDG
ncbi:MAG: alpha/beta fold hydrolase [Paraperlucidibaca sp.]